MVLSYGQRQFLLRPQSRNLASQDGLTGLANRRSFDDAVRREWRRSLRTGAAVSLLMVVMAVVVLAAVRLAGERI